MADFGNPVVVGGQFSVLSTEIFFAIVGAQYDQGRAASLAWLLTLFALACSRCSAGCWARSYTTVSGKGDAGVPMALPDGVRGWSLHRAAVDRVHAGGLPVRLRRRLRADLGPRLHAHAGALRTAFALEWGEFGLVWAGTAWNSLFTTLKLAAISAPLTAALGLLIAWLLARTSFRGQGFFEFARCWPSRFPARCWA
jgi:iron(III) transport system permease protein